MYVESGNGMVVSNAKVCPRPFKSRHEALFTLVILSSLIVGWPIHPAKQLVLFVFCGVARLTQDKIGLWYDHETHLFLYIVCTLGLRRALLTSV